MTSTDVDPVSIPANSPITDRVLALREHTGARVDLRRGGSAATAHYAYRWLAPLWANGEPWLRDPLLRFAALVAANPGVPDGERNLGRYLRDATGGDEARRDAVGRKLTWVQTGDLDKFHHAMRTLVGRNGASGPLSWDSVWGFYRRWDHTDAPFRTGVRRRLLEQFYA